MACSIADLESEPGLFLSNKEVIDYIFFSLSPQSMSVLDKNMLFKKKKTNIG